MMMMSEREVGREMGLDKLHLHLLRRDLRRRGAHRLGCNGCCSEGWGCLRRCRRRDRLLQRRLLSRLRKQALLTYMQLRFQAREGLLLRGWEGCRRRRGRRRGSCRCRSRRGNQHGCGRPLLEPGRDPGR